MFCLLGEIPAGAIICCIFEFWQDFLVLKANSLFFFFEKLQLQFQEDYFIINTTGLDLIIIGIGVGKGRE